MTGQTRRGRPGVLMLEAAAAAAVISLAIVAAVPALTAAAQARRTAAARLLALEELHSLVTKRAGQRADAFDAIILREDARRFLPDARVSRRVEPVEDLPGTRITLTLTWGQGRSESLVTWIWDDGGVE